MAESTQRAGVVLDDGGDVMASAKRGLAAAMWENRPSLLELLFLTILVLAGHIAMGLPVVLLATAMLLLVVGGTLQQAIVALRKSAPRPATTSGEDGHAED